MATIQEILVKIQNGTAIASDYEELAKLSNEQAEVQKKAEATAKSLIETIKKAKIEPKILTNLLASEGLIVLPEIKNNEGKTVIIEEPITTKEGRSSKFKIWVGRDVGSLVGDAKTYWTNLKAKGKDYFIKNLNADGQKYYETEDGKKWIESLFK